MAHTQQSKDSVNKISSSEEATKKTNARRK